MTRLIPLALAAALAAAPALAQDAPTEGPSLLDRGLESFLQNFAEDVQPPLTELLGISATYLGEIQGFLEEMGPAFAEVVGQVDSFTYYEPPEITPGGDIVIRRRADAPTWVPQEARPDSAPDSGPETAPEVTPGPAPEEDGGGWFDFDLTPDPVPQGEIEL